MNRSQRARDGFRCPVRGCLKRDKNLYSKMGIVMHLIACHPGELEKRLRVKRHVRRKNQHGREVFVQEP